MVNFGGRFFRMSGLRIFSGGVLPVSVFLIIIYVLRDIPGMMSPPLFNEDGPNMIDFYTDSHDPARIFRFYGGYVSVGPNLIGYLAGFLPLAVAVHTLYWAPLIIAALTFGALCHPSFTLPGLTGRERAFVALMLGLFPASNMALTTNTTFSLWHLAILLCFMSLMWRPGSWAGAGFGIVFGMIAATSHPVSLILVPFLAWRVWRAETALERWTFLPVLVVIPIYIALGVAPDGGSTDVAVLSTLGEAIRLFLERGIFETLFSTPVRIMFLYRGLEPVLWICAGALLVLMFWQAKGMVRVLVLALLIIGFGNSLFSALARDMPLGGTWGHRYGYLSGVLFLMAAMLSVLPALRRWPAGPGLIRRGVLAVLAAGMALSFVLKLPYYRNDPVMGAEVVQMIAAHRAAPDTPCLRVERAEWSFEIRQDQTAPCTTLPPIAR